MVWRISRTNKLAGLLAMLAALTVLSQPVPLTAGEDLDGCGGENELICAGPSLGCEDEEEQERACDEVCGEDWQAVACDSDGFCEGNQDSIVCEPEN